jgi:hypothetical protein
VCIGTFDNGNALYLLISEDSEYSLCHVELFCCTDASEIPNGYYYAAPVYVLQMEFNSCWADTFMPGFKAFWKFKKNVPIKNTSNDTIINHPYWADAQENPF